MKHVLDIVVPVAWLEAMTRHPSLFMLMADSVCHKLSQDVSQSQQSFGFRTAREGKYEVKRD